MIYFAMCLLHLNNWYVPRMEHNLLHTGNKEVLFPSSNTFGHLLWAKPHGCAELSKDIKIYNATFLPLRIIWFRGFNYINLPKTKQKLKLQEKIKNLK